MRLLPYAVWFAAAFVAVGPPRAQGAPVALGARPDPTLLAPDPPLPHWGPPDRVPFARQPHPTPQGWPSRRWASPSAGTATPPPASARRSTSSTWRRRPRTRPTPR